MSLATTPLATIPAPNTPVSLVDEIAALGSELNANQYRIVCLAAEYDVGLEWDDRGYRRQLVPSLRRSTFTRRRRMSGRLSQKPQVLLFLGKNIDNRKRRVSAPRAIVHPHHDPRRRTAPNQRLKQTATPDDSPETSRPRNPQPRMRRLPKNRPTRTRPQPAL